MKTIERLSDSQRRHSLAAVILHMMGVGLTLGLAFPLTSLTLQGWGASEWVIGVAGAMSPLAVLLLMPVLPRLASRLGAIRAMLIGCALAASALLAMYWLPSVPAWIAARFVLGAGLALPWLVGDVWINTVAEERSRGKVIAAYAASFFAGFAAGPLLLDWIGIGGLAPHLAGVAALALAVLPLAWVRHLAPAIELDAASGLFAAVKAVPVAATGAFLSGFTEGVAFTLAPVWGLEIGYSPALALRLLSVFIVGGIVLQVLSGAVADKWDRQRLLVVAGAGLTLICIWLYLAPGVADFTLSFAAGGLVLALYSLSLTLLGQSFRPSQLAMASAAFLILYQLGSMAGPVLAGLLMEELGASGYLLALGLAGALMAAVAAVNKPKLQPAV